MKKHLFVLTLIAFTPLLLHSQAGTFHQKFEGTFVPDFYPPEWQVTVTWQFIVNQVQKVYDDGKVEIRYTNNYRSQWIYVNTVTGQRLIGPENENVTGVYYFNVNTGESGNDRHWVYHYVNDPIFGAYHVNYNLLWTFNPDTGFMEVIDIQNEWQKN